MKTAQDIVDAARAYLGVPFMHRGRSKLGVDCAGLAWCAFKDAQFVLPDADYVLYGREPNNGELERCLTQALGAAIAVAPVHVLQLKIGDVLAIRFKTRPHHVAIVTDYPYGGLAVIHSSGETGKVIEHRLSDDMVARITHVFRMKF